MPQPTAEQILGLAEVVASAATELGIETAVIGAMAMAAHRYVRATGDADLGTYVEPGRELVRLRDALSARGLRVALHLPDDDDPLGGVLRVWELEDDEGEPTYTVDVVNFQNPHAPARRSPGQDAVRNALVDPTTGFRVVRLAHLIALKLYAASSQDERDIVELLVRNPDADIAEIQAVCAAYGLESALRNLIDQSRSRLGSR